MKIKSIKLLLVGLMLTVGSSVVSSNASPLSPEDDNGGHRWDIICGTHYCPEGSAHEGFMYCGEFENTKDYDVWIEDVEELQC